MEEHVVVSTTALEEDNVTSCAAVWSRAGKTSWWLLIFVFVKRTVLVCVCRWKRRRRDGVGCCKRTGATRERERAHAVWRRRLASLRWPVAPVRLLGRPAGRRRRAAPLCLICIFLLLKVKKILWSLDSSLVNEKMYQVTKKVLADFTNAATFRAAVIVSFARSSCSGHFLKANVWIHRPT